MKKIYIYKPSILVDAYQLRMKYLDLILTLETTIRIHAISYLSLYLSIQRFQA